MTLLVTLYALVLVVLGILLARSLARAQRLLEDGVSPEVPPATAKRPSR